MAKFLDQRNRHDVVLSNVRGFKRVKNYLACDF